jgi:hypothetical protein
MWPFTAAQYNGVPPKLPSLLKTKSAWSLSRALAKSKLPCLTAARKSADRSRAAAEWGDGLADCGGVAGIEGMERDAVGATEIWVDLLSAMSAFGDSLTPSSFFKKLIVGFRLDGAVIHALFITCL